MKDRLRLPAAFADERGESEAIARWCHERLASDPLQRLLVICADRNRNLTELREEVLRALSPGDPEALEARVAVEGGEPLRNQPLVATAIALLRLGEEALDFVTLGAVLTSPYHAVAGANDGARLDLWLRDRMPERCGRAQILALLRTAPPSLAAPASRFATTIERAATLQTGRARAAEEWARNYSALLEDAGHPGTRRATSAETQAWERWQASLEEFASLGAILGPLDPGEAQARFEGLLRRARHQAATGDAPVTLTVDLGDPLVGYDGIWVAGLGEGQWPEPPRPNPYLPFAAQRQAGMPESSARHRLVEGRAQLQAWRQRSASPLQISHARAQGDLEVTAAVLLHGLPIEAMTHEAAAGPAGGVALEAVVDERLPAIDVRVPLRAGVRLPELQRECPFRSQAELRFGARGLAAPRIGIDPRLRGQLLHDALDHLWRAIGDSRRLRALSPAQQSECIEAALNAAFAKIEVGASVAPSPRELDRERARSGELLDEVLALERRREVDFVVDSRERTVPWRVAGIELRLRIDRVDRLGDDSVAVVDYKTGSSAKLDLDSDAPRPVQLMAYLDALSGGVTTRDVAALSLLKLVPGQPEFRAVEDGRARLPVPRARARVDQPWAERLERWRRDVHQLVANHVAGDAAVRPLPGACAYCALPALCRIDGQALSQTLAVTDDEDAE